MRAEKANNNKWLQMVKICTTINWPLMMRLVAIRAAKVKAQPQINSGSALCLKLFVYCTFSFSLQRQQQLYTLMDTDYVTRNNNNNKSLRNQLKHT